MLSAFNDRDNVVRALDKGALGFIPKTDSSREVLLGALRLILAGGMYIPPEILDRASHDRDAPRRQYSRRPAQRARRRPTSASRNGRSTCWR